MELAPFATSVLRQVDISRGNPHAYWMSHNDKIVVAPNVITADTTQYNFNANTIDAILTIGTLPFSHLIAAQMMPNVSKHYVANLLGKHHCCKRHKHTSLH